MNLIPLFLKFLKLGFTGWGGPIGRIALMHEELVVKEKWIDEKKFGKVLVVYQALPGPEATELACYFGYKERGRIGSIVSGLGFMLPGFILMLIASYLYVNYGLKIPEVNAVLYGIRPVVAALIIHAIYKLGKANITDIKLVAIAAISLVIFLFTKIDFLIILAGAGFVSFLLYNVKIKRPSAKSISPFILPILQFYSQLQLPQIPLLFLLFLKAGLLTFGGAYSVVAFLQQSAVYENHWLTNEQYLDGLSIGAVMPAPMVIIGTFVGYLAGGVTGAIIATVGIFLPAFAFTLMGYEYIEKAVDNKKLQFFLLGLTASVIGLVAATWLQLLPIAVIDIPTIALALIALYLIIKKFNFIITILGSGIIGLILKFVIHI